MNVLLLTVIQGPDRGRRHELPGNVPQLIGRSSEAIPLADPTVSRRHAELTPDDGAWFIRDLASQNGTFVNGKKISGRHRLQPGDQIRTGATLWLYGREDSDELAFVELLSADEIQTSVERRIASNEDSVVMAEPEPAAAAEDHLRIIYELTRLTSQALDEQELLSNVLNLIFDEFKPERGFIITGVLASDRQMRPAVARFHSQPASPEAAGIKVSRTIVQHVLRTAEGVLSTNAMSDKRFASGESVQGLHIHSAVCSPMTSGKRVFGAIYIDSSMSNFTFTEGQLALLNAIGRHTGLAMANAELYREKLAAERLAGVGETVASLSHSIRNILQGLRGGADVVEIGLQKEDLKTSRTGWDILKRNMDRIAGLTQNMLAFSRPIMPEVALTQVVPIVEECAELLAATAASKQVALLVDAEPEMPPIPADAGLMHQALLNLLTNAVEAAPEKTGHVTVRVAFHPPGARGDNSPAIASVSVIDNGPGLSKERQTRLFTPFNTTKGARGTGLGLVVTKRIIDMHRGVLRVESDAGAGTTFHVLLPADQGQAVDPSATTPSTPSSFGFEIDPPF